MSILAQSFQVRLNFISPILGSLPADPELLSKYIASRAPSPLQQDEEEGVAQEVDAEKSLTVFARDETGLFFYDYHIKGFIKEAGNTLKEAVKTTALRSKIDNYLFVFPRRIYICRENGVPIQKEDEFLERPLRAQTALGPRIALAKSERINLPITCQFTVEILENKKDVSWETVQKLLDYGRYKGLGQWRNGGWGRFEWEEVKE